MKKIKTLIAAAVLGLGVTVSSISPAAVSMQTAEAATVKQGLVKYGEETVIRFDNWCKLFLGE